MKAQNFDGKLWSGKVVVGCKWMRQHEESPWSCVGWNKFDHLMQLFDY